jgi:hypothetical protein
MRIWDVNPGYLNRQSLLGEHREIHGLFNVVHGKKTGYSHHPETLRWFGKLSALKKRHDLLVSEMRLRGYGHYTPMEETGGSDIQNNYVDPPFRQFGILSEKYREKENGRIPLPANSQQLWAQHKYSILARDPEYYKSIGPQTAKDKSWELFERLSLEFVEKLSTAPEHGRLINGLQHMWGYISSFAPTPQPPEDLEIMLEIIRSLSVKHDVAYLLHSTALSELMVYIRGDPGRVKIK